MKKGICFELIGRRSFKDCFELYRTVGFNGVELTLGTKYLGLNTSDEDLQLIRKMSEDNEVEIVSIRGGPILNWKRPITNNDISLRRKTIDDFKRLIEIAYTLGADTVLMVPGAVTEEVGYEEAYKRAHETIRDILAKAEEVGVFLALENVDNNFLLSPLEVRNFLDSLRSKWVGMYLDVGNVLYCKRGYPEDWIRIMDKRIKKVHVKDCTRNGHITCLLEGELNWPKIMNALRDIEYDDYLIAELPLYTFLPERMLERTSRDISALINEF